MPAISFDLNSIDWNLTLVLGRAIFLVLGFTWAAVAFTRWRRATERSAAQFAQLSEQVLARLAQLDARIETTQAGVSELSERVALLNSSASGKAAAPSYEIAIRMAKSGAVRDDLMASCGLTRQEAELVLRLHATAPPQRLAAVG
jgi:hypothetical protein